MATTNIGLQEVAQSQTFGQWLEAFNSNMAEIDGLPIPIDYGKNTTMEYLKLSNGKVIMWGNIDFGTNKPCNVPWNTGYSSESFSVDFPIALTSTKTTIVTHVQCSQWIACECYSKEINYTNALLWFVSDVNDSLKNNNKSLNIFIIGDWK